MTFSHVFTVLRRRWLTVLLGVLLGTVAAGVFAIASPTRYSATTSLVVSSLVTNPFTDSREEVNIRTEREIISSREVAERASQALDVKLAPDSFLLSQVDVAAPSGSQILQVTVQAASPAQAARAADAISKAYLDFRREGADETAARYLEKIDEQLLELRNQQPADVNQRLTEALQQQRLSVTLTSAEPGRIIGKATVPSRPSSPGLAVSLAGGLVGGFLLGVAFALARERLDRSVRSTDRLARVVAPACTVIGGLDDVELWDNLGDEILKVSEKLASARKTRVLLQPVDLPSARKSADRLRNAVMSMAEATTSTTDIKPERAEDVLVSICDPDSTPARAARVARAADVVVVLVPKNRRLNDVATRIGVFREAAAEVIVALVRDSNGSEADTGVALDTDVVPARRSHRAKRPYVESIPQG
ncbi:hypothetical protein CW368_09205 [Actinomycetales bacterium SN12]|nr:hypothetical protein CW368_09205 [Actinomycetales bacterium SN12]